MKWQNLEIVFDVAHNEQGVSAVLREMKRTFSTDFVVVCGFGVKKDVESIIKLFCLEERISGVYPISCQHFRIQAADELYKSMLKFG